MGREGKTPKAVIYTCTGSSCKKKGGKEISKFLKSKIKQENLKNEIEVIKTDCTDRCKLAPVISFQPENIWLTQAGVNQIEKVFESEILSKFPKS